MAQAASIPTGEDLEGLEALLRRLLAEGQTEQLIHLVLKVVRQLVAENSRLQLRLNKLLRERFGRSSEKLDPAQLTLMLQELKQETAAEETETAPPVTEPPTAPPEAASSATLDPNAAQLPASPPGGAPSTAAAAAAAAGAGQQTEQAKPPKRQREGHGRRPLPPEFPREERVHLPTDEELWCEPCGKPKSRCGEERSEMLEWVPGHFKVLVDIRPKYTCRCCGEGLVIAPPADKVIEKGLPGPALLAHLLVSKYREHMPLNRLARFYQRHGFEVRTSTLVGWVAACAVLLMALAQRLYHYALVSYILQSDDTPIRVLDRAHPAGIRRGRIWVYLGDQKWVAMVYTPNWKEQWPLSFLDKRVGWVLVDGYRGYDKLFTREGATAVEAGCWSHARRYFVKALDAGDKRAAQPLVHINRLFAIEAQATEEGVSETERLERRQEQSQPQLEALKAWATATLAVENPKSPLAEACFYLLNQWTPLTRFLEDARLPLHNNACELRLRDVTVGKNNYLFVGSEEGGHRAACIYSLIATCVLAGIDPEEYLRDVLSKLAAGWPQNKIDDLLPPMWKAAREKQAAAQAIH